MKRAVDEANSFSLWIYPDRTGSTNSVRRATNTTYSQRVFLRTCECATELSFRQNPLGAPRIEHADATGEGQLASHARQEAAAVDDEPPLLADDSKVEQQHKVEA